MVQQSITEVKALLEQASWNRTVFFNFTDKDGNKTARHVEVYDIKEDTYFFGVETNDKISRPKRFAIDRVSDISLGDEFVPRWERNTSVS